MYLRSIHFSSRLTVFQTFGEFVAILLVLFAKSSVHILCSQQHRDALQCNEQERTASSLRSGPRSAFSCTP